MTLNFLCGLVIYIEYRKWDISDNSFENLDIICW